MATFPQTAKETSGTRTQAEAPRILAADDQPHILDAIELLLQPEGYRVERAQSPREVRDRVASETYDALLIDLNYTRDTTSGAEGLELLAQLSAHDSRLRIIVMTAWANVDLAVESMRRGACDFIQKPWENVRLISVLRTQIELRRAVRQAEILEAENRLLRAEGRPELIAKAASMQPVLELLARIGPSDANVLITGEHGTGKEVVAQTLHALSSRSARSLVAVNTGALAEGTFESELFGHVKGAFTDARTDRIGRFELADRGTLFLDEIANVPLRQQAKLLRVLETGDLERVGSSQTKRVNVRLISATNADLHEECAQGRFREDLLFRLNTVEIHLPPLRDRREDIPSARRALPRPLYFPLPQGCDRLRAQRPGSHVPAQLAGQRQGTRPRHRARCSYGSRSAHSDRRPGPEPGSLIRPESRRTQPRSGGKHSHPQGAGSRGRQRQPCGGGPGT